MLCFIFLISDVRMVLSPWRLQCFELQIASLARLGAQWAVFFSVRPFSLFVLLVCTTRQITPGAELGWLLEKLLELEVGVF